MVRNHRGGELLDRNGVATATRAYDRAATAAGTVAAAAANAAPGQRIGEQPVEHRYGARRCAMRSEKTADLISVGERASCCTGGGEGREALRKQLAAARWWHGGAEDDGRVLVLRKHRVDTKRLHVV